MNLTQAFLSCLLISILGVISWELYWRSQGYYPNLDDNHELWALQRTKLETATEDDVVIIGSSRAYFDLQLYPWEAITGKRPIQLAIEGTSPQYLFEDIVENSNFKGTLIIGVTEGLFFSTLYPEAPPNQNSIERVQYYQDRTYAQRLNHLVSLPLQNTLAFVSESEGTDGIKLKALIEQAEKGYRVPDPMPPFHNFGDVDKNRNLRMTERTANDTTFAATIKKVWLFFAEGASKFPPEKKATTEFFLKNLEKFTARGGKAILLRPPSTGKVRDFERKGLPRISFWDSLVTQANVPAYHYEDHASLRNFDCPEWSHLSGPDADIFTENFVALLLKEGHLKAQ